MACMSPGTVDRNWRVGVNPRLPAFPIGTSCTGPAHLPRFRHKSTKRSSLSVGSRFIGVLRCPVSLSDVTSQRAAHLLAPTRNWHISNILRKAGTNPAIAWSNEVSWRPDCNGVRRRGCAMAVPAGSLNYVKPTPTIFELEALEGLPCGCVAAAFRARPWDVAVVSLEAKGPHCNLAGHTSGQVLRLGDPSEFDEDDDEE